MSVDSGHFGCDRIGSEPSIPVPSQWVSGGNNQPSVAPVSLVNSQTSPSPLFPVPPQIDMSWARD